MSTTPVLDAMLAVGTPISAWKLSEPSGTSAADSKDSNAGTYANGTSGGFVLNQASVLTNGESASTKLVASKTGRISIPHATNLNLGDTFSILAWVNLNSTGIRQSILSQGAGDFNFRVRDDNLFGLDKNNVAPIAYSTTTLGTGTPHLLGTAKNGGTSTKLFLDGVEETNSYYVNATIVNTSSAAEIGRRAGGFGDELMDAFVMYVVVYSNAIVASDALAVWNSRMSLLLGTPGGSSTTTFSISAQTQIPLSASAGQSAATLSLTAKTTVALGTSAAQSTTSLGLATPARVALGTSAAVSSTALSLSAQTTITAGAAAGQSNATLALTAPATITLSTSAAVSTSALALTIVPLLSLSSSATSTATLVIRVPTFGIPTTLEVLARNTSLMLFSHESIYTLAPNTTGLVLHSHQTDAGTHAHTTSAGVDDRETTLTTDDRETELAIDG